MDELNSSSTMRSIQIHSMIFLHHRPFAPNRCPRAAQAIRMHTTTNTSKDLPETSSSSSWEACLALRSILTASMSTDPKAMGPIERPQCPRRPEAGVSREVEAECGPSNST